MTTLSKSAHYHSKVGVLTLLSGTMQMHGPAAILPLAQGTIDGLRQFLVANLSAREAYELLQRAADEVAEEVVKSSPLVRKDEKAPPLKLAAPPRPAKGR